MSDPDTDSGSDENDGRSSQDAPTPLRYDIADLSKGGSDNSDDE
jgi:hypothetical protein